MYNNESYSISTNIRKVSDEWILCLHGIQSNKELFSDIFSIPLFDKYSMLAIDFVGFGESDKPENFSYDINDQAHLCSALIEKLKIDKAHIIGHSLGGMVGTVLLNLQKNKISSFVNMEGNLVLEDCGLSLDVAGKSFEEFRNSYFSKIRVDLEKSHEIGADKRRKAIELVPDYAFYKTSRSIVEWSKSRKLLDIFVSAPQRKLFMYGQRNSHKTKVLPKNMKTATINNAGHFMLLENPDECYKKIEEFLSY